MWGDTNYHYRIGSEPGLRIRTHIFVVGKARNRECKCLSQAVIRCDEAVVFEALSIYTGVCLTDLELQS